MNLRIRDFRPGDEAAAYHVCLKTGDHGNDGEPFFKEDPDALGRIYVGPYLRFAPELALMLEDDDGVCGYTMGVVDSKEFFQRYESEWRPEMTSQFAEPSGDRSTWSRVEEVHYEYHHPDYFCPEPYAEYPAHLHIDLMARAQGKGFGRKLMHELLTRLRATGVAGVHLGMSINNDRAFGFYQKLGFHELTRDTNTIYMGMRFADSVITEAQNLESRSANSATVPASAKQNPQVAGDSTNPDDPSLRIWVDADACPMAIKEILFRTSKRLKVKLILVANQSMKIPRSEFVQLMLVPHGADAADHKVIELMQAGDIVITGDIPLAARVVEKSGVAIGTRGELFDDDSVHDRLASRNLMEQFRAAGVDTRGPKPLDTKDVQAFANQLDRILTRRFRGK